MTLPHSLAISTVDLHRFLSAARTEARTLGHKQMVRQIDIWLNAGSLAHFAARNTIRDCERAERHAIHDRLMAHVQTQEMLAVINPRKAA